MRYHSNIFAAKVGIPFVAIEYEEKMTGFIEMIGFKEMGIPIINLSKNSLLFTFSNLENNYMNYKKKLKERSINLKNIANKTINLLPDIEQFS